MKKLLSMAAITLLTGAFLDPLIKSGMEKPVAWGMDLGMAAAGFVCVYLLVKHRHEL